MLLSAFNCRFKRVDSEPSATCSSSIAANCPRQIESCRSCMGVPHMYVIGGEKLNILVSNDNVQMTWSRSFPGQYDPLTHVARGAPPLFLPKLVSLGEQICNRVHRARNHTIDILAVCQSFTGTGTFIAATCLRILNEPLSAGADVII